MDNQIHHLEKEAYFSVLRAFKAQSDAITWDKEGLITELRKELRVSDDEHREVLNRVNDDEAILRIREWRQTGRHQASALLPNHGVPGPTISVSRKKLRTSQPLPDLFVPSSAIHPHSAATPMQPSPSTGSLGRKSKLNSVANGKNPYRNNGSSGVVMPHETVPLGKELIGQKVYTRWPDDNKFYEAVITQFNPLEVRHALVYDANTDKETWEWVDLAQIPPNDIRWASDDPGISHRGVVGDKTSTSPTLLAAGNYHKNELCYGNRKMNTPDIEIFHTETLIKVVEKVISASNPNLSEIDKAKKMLKEHEEALEYAISKLKYTSDGESGNECICIC
ncbi:hypothetical protein V2J09_009349 [Rumex salicifolius]